MIDPQQQSQYEDLSNKIKKRYFSALMRRSWDVVTNRWPTRWFLAAKIRTPGSMKKRCLEPTDGFQSTLHMFDPKISPVNGEPIIDDAPVGYGWFARQTGLLTGQMSNLSQEICKFGGHHLPFGKVSNVSTIHKLVWISYQMTIIQFRQDHNIIYIYISMVVTICYNMSNCTNTTMRWQSWSEKNCQEMSNL